MAPIPMFDHMFATVSELPICPIVVLASAANRQHRGYYSDD